ncbi:MAG TPA: hypothetical protein PK800_00940 [Syntrophorhabdaceae bacterium]|nr:hypothetical protein [Syntrophorhabdaceae bacterium]
MTKPALQNNSDIVSLKTKQGTKTENVYSNDKEENHLTEKQRIARLIIEFIYGKKIFNISTIKNNNEMPEENHTQQSQETISIDLSEKIEKEDVYFQGEGSVTTEDGKTYDFNVSFRLSRSLYEKGLSISKTQNKDPLVLNLTGMFTGLSEKTVDFDIDADGINDTIHFPKEGSGFLVIDKNNDGIINDGKEVIGTQTNNALSELTNYDEDKNGWIDENDVIFASLSIWEKDKSGKDKITPLKDKGIGALNLSYVMTPFQIKNVDTPYGEITDSGIFLFENGKASVFHRINLFV